MSTTNAATFACEACGKGYRWRPEFAGKKLRCACGNVMHLTTPPPPQMPNAAVHEAPLIQAPRRAAAACPGCSSPIAPGAAICINCGFNFQTGAHVQTEVLADAPAAPKQKNKGAPAAKSATKPGAATSFPRRILADDPEEVAAKARWDDIYWPIVAVVIGLILSVVDAMWAQQIDDWTHVVAWVMLFAIVDVTIGFIGVVITAKLLTIGLGTYPIALLKVTAIALAPGAVGSIITTKIPMSGMFAWCLMLILYYILFNKFFDMDFQEMLICAAIMMVTRIWLAYFLVAAIMTNLLGFRSAIFDGGYDDEDDQAPSKQDKTKKSPQKMKQKAPKDDESDEEAMVYPIGDRAMVVFFDPARKGTYHLGVGVVPAQGV